MNIKKFRIVFLDIDGVLCTKDSIQEAISDWCGGLNIDEDEWVKQYKGIAAGIGFFPKLDMFHWPFDRLALKNIHHLARHPDVRFVISSTWREDRTTQDLIDLFTMKGLNVRIIDRTRDGHPGSHTDTRAHEIQDWLDANKDIVESYVILDDNTWDIIRLHPNNTVTTRDDVGFDKASLEKAKEILFKDVV